MITTPTIRRALVVIAASAALAGCASAPAAGPTEPVAAVDTPPTYALLGGVSGHCPPPCPTKIVGDVKLTFAGAPGTWGFEINTQAEHLIFQPPSPIPNQNVALGPAVFFRALNLALVSTTAPVTVGGQTGALTFLISCVPRGNHFEGVSAGVWSPNPALAAGFSQTTENRGLNVFPDCEAQ